MLRMFAVAALAAFLPQAAHAAGLAGSEWGFAGDDLAFVQFAAEGRISGKAYCNRFTGGYEAGDDGSFSTGSLAVTRMFCAGDLMEKERDFLQRLQNAKSFARDGIRLQLRDTAGKILFDFTQRDAD